MKELFVTVGTFVAVLIALVVAESVVIHIYRPWKRKRQLDPLEELMRQERIKQAVPLVTLVAMNLPVDVIGVTLITRYSDGCDLVLECGRPERIEEPKEL